MRLMGFLFLILLLGGCGTEKMALDMVGPRHHGGEVDGVGERRVTVEAGPPWVEIAVWNLEPAKGVEGRGTVLVLHGYDGDHRYVRKEAEALSLAGYRAVMVDLRGHGESTGEFVTYGEEEVRDLARVTSYLQKHGLAGKSVGVYGVSYGAAVAILYAGSDARVGAVVAVAAYANLREQAARYRRMFKPVPGLFFSAGQQDEITTEAGRFAGFNPDEENPVDAMGRTKAAVLLIHGVNDRVVPVGDAERLHEADLVGSEVRVLKDAGHVAVSRERVEEVRGLSVEWFEEHLGS